MVNSKLETKKYFLPVYLTWAIVTPTIVTFMTSYLNTPEGASIVDFIPWTRVLSFYTLFGLVWPLTIVISPAFFVSIKEITSYSFFEALTVGFSSKALLSYILISIAWIGPLISLISVFYLHKKLISLQSEEPEKFGWIDYLAGFI
ncbi:MAG: hypothetical protein ACPHM3_01775 [Candidatus Kariarchaeum pelagius]|tara:strand:+ start:4377 stop:4814 length:438 start_codon:yes stop_codon:yes gene_type:complete